MAFLNQLVEAELARLNCPGCSVAVLRDREVVSEAGFGLANVEHEIVATPDSVYEIASITKLFTATAVMQLVQNGQVALNRPIATYLDGLPATWQPITVKQILSHQSGIPSYTSLDAYWDTTRLDIGVDGILALVRDLPLLAPPGTRYAYDNTGYYLLGLLIEAVSGQAYAEFLQAHIFAPLSMTATCANDPYRPISHRAAGYTVSKAGVLQNKAYYSPSGTFSAGVLLSSVVDLARFAQVLYSDQLLDAPWRRMMWEACVSAEKNELTQNFRLGLGWFLVDWEKRRFAGHNGSIVGFASSFAHFLDNRTTVILLCNSDVVTEPHLLAFKIMEAALEAL